MKIGELAAASSTPIETIRYYEREALLPAPPRTEGNFRLYESSHLERLRFIRHCRGLDMSLDEIRVLLRVRDGQTDDCGDVDALLDEHIAHVAGRIKDLKALARQLDDLRKRCCTPQSPDRCGILSGLEEGSLGSPAVVLSPARHVR